MRPPIESKPLAATIKPVVNGAEKLLTPLAVTLTRVT
jgi:hypothetical protein